MATFVQILIAAVLSLFGMNPDGEIRTDDKKEVVIEAALQTHDFLLPAEQNEYKKWEFITTDRTIANTIIED